jgi:hypothetical protein
LRAAHGLRVEFDAGQRRKKYVDLIRVLMLCIYTTPECLCDGKAPLSKNEHYQPYALGNV